MILPAQMIRSRRNLITPFCERSVHNGLSYGLTSAGYDVRLAEGLYIDPGRMELGSTTEQFNMHDDLLGIVHDKSTWARRGIAVQNTVIEPGWRGFLTLELSNHSYIPIHIPSGTPIAQIIFHLLYEPTKQPYRGKYQDQEAGPQLPRMERVSLDAPSHWHTASEELKFARQRIKDLEHENSQLQSSLEQYSAEDRLQGFHVDQLRQETSES